MADACSYFLVHCSSTYSALPHTAVLAAVLGDGVDVDEVVVGRDGQEVSIYRHKELTVSGLQKNDLTLLCCRSVDRWLLPGEYLTVEMISLPSVCTETRSRVSVSSTNHLQRTRTHKYTHTHEYTHTHTHHLRMIWTVTTLQTKKYHYCKKGLSIYYIFIINLLLTR